MPLPHAPLPHTPLPHTPPPLSGTPAPHAPATVGNAWRTGLVTNLLTPKIAVFYTGLLPTLALPRLPATWAMTLLVLLHAVLTLVWLGGYVLLLSKAASVLERPRVRRVLGRTTGVVLIGFGLTVGVAAR
ncbi:LysE family translocator [Streptomyces sp. NPDC051243]|uniref:LysE family translocator n=1 Tax=Streptomyces sp. NPDC051243 TaxID=3365646 RepID=UPI0037BCBB05